MSPDFLDIVRALSDADARFIIVGALIRWVRISNLEFVARLGSMLDSFRLLIACRNFGPWTGPFGRNNANRSVSVSFV